MTDSNDIERLIRANFAAFEAGSADGMRAMDHPESTIWDVFLPDLIVGAEGRAAFRKGDIAQSKTRGRLAMTIDEPLVDVWEDTALARYYLRFSYEPPNATEGHVRITDVYRRIGGEWQRMHHHEGMVPAGVPPIAE
jgi:hypothetical protein